MIDRATSKYSVTIFKKDDVIHVTISGTHLQSCVIHRFLISVHKTILESFKLLKGLLHLNHLEPLLKAAC